ncbi:MAG: site-specific integrase [Zavarzinella sp.]|nr:site-specific integrase [Zavarzinella sp.]
MSRADSVPSYRKHKPTKQAVVTLTDPAGGRRDYYLGRHGSAESRAEYARLIAEWNAAGRCLPHNGPAPADLTINELLLRFWRHIDGYYRDAAGNPTREAENFKHSLRPLKLLYGHTQARDFTPLSLEAVRQSMIDAGLARRVINQRVGRIRRCFKWAAAKMLVPASVYHALQAVEGLAVGRTAAPEPEKIGPVPDDVVEATFPKLNRHVAGMVRFQRLTGCRPQDVCNLRRCEIDTTGNVWVYRPERHKGAWRGKERVIAIGPKAQAVLAEFPTADPTEYVFSPRRMTEERLKLLRAARKSKVQPSQVSRAKRKPRTRPGGRYSPRAYRLAVVRACGRAGVGPWHPNQLRHSRGTEVRKAFGLEAAQVVLGHAQARVTEVYAESDAELAARVALATG